jgi:hypothetical protein
MSRLIRRIFDRANEKYTPRARMARPARTAAGQKARLMLQVLEERAVPTAFTVTSTADSGAGTLRAAIIAADADVNTPHTIDMTGITGTITLATSLPQITKDMTITGPGASGLTLNVNNQGQGFNQGTANFGVSGFTITGASNAGSGGAIYVGPNDNLTVSNAVITGNKSGGSGPAIYFYDNGSLAITSTSITNNSGGSSAGGGVYFFGTASSYTISNSTIANNTGINGAGISFQAFGGTANITNSTITGNTASGSGGGINGYAGIVLDNTIVSGNTAGSGPDISDTNTTAGVTATYSALGTTTGYTLNASSSFNVIGGALNLQPLGSFTGPGGTYPIVKLGAGSAAIDVGDPGQNGQPDQVGNTRGSMGAGVDIGAVEKVPGPPGGTATGTTVTDANASTSNPYQFTVAYSADVAMNYSTINGNSGAVTVTAPAGVTLGPVSFVSATPTSNAQTITATYQFSVTGGWTAADDGSYTVNMVANQVKDTSNLFVPAGSLGTFNVALAFTGANALVVTNTGDAGVGTGLTGDLRYVMTKAATALGTSTPNQINFSNSTAGGATDFTSGPHTITLGSALPAIPENVVITGPGASLLTVARSGGAGFGLMNINGPTAQTVTLSGMTLTGGSTGSGGGITMADQTLTLNGMALTANTASDGGAVYVSGAGTVNLNNSSVSGNSAFGGGGFWVPGAGIINITNSTLNSNSGSSGGALDVTGPATVTILNSTLANNTGFFGAAIDAYFQNPNISITNSTLSGNTVGDDGGAIYFAGSGAFTITTSTLANNAAPFGGAIDAVNVGTGITLTSVTMTGNSATTGGGINFASGAGAISFDNSILAGNTATTGPNVAAGGALVVNSQYDAIDDTTGFTYVAGVGDVPTTLASLHLSPLQLNNGGTTQTFALGAGGSGVNVGDPGLVGTTDQNGVSRPQGSGVDIGSTERVIPGVPFAQANTTNVTDANATTSNPYQFTVTYSADTLMNFTTINGNNSAISVTAPAGVTIGAVTFVSATPTSNAASITATYQFTVTGGWSPADNGTYTVNMAANQVKDTNNAAVAAGPIGTFKVSMAYTGANALVVTNTGDAGVGSGLGGDLRYCLTMSAGVLGTSTPNEIVFSNNTTGGNTNFYDGTAHTITINSALPAIPDNVTITGPGASKLTVARSASAPAFGMLNVNGTASQTVGLTGFTLSGGLTNAFPGAGAIAFTAQSLTLTNMAVTNNSSTIAAGGIGEFGNGSLTLVNTTISGNSGVYGGGVYLDYGTTSTTSITGCTISNNVAGGVGGSPGAGVDIVGHGSVNITNTTISNNSAPFGGAVALFLGNATLTITGSTLSGCTAGLGGGAMYFTGTGALDITNSTIANNTAGASTSFSGGGIDANNSGAVITLTSVTMTGNSASGSGGAINFPSGTGSITLDNTIISGNSAGGTGQNIFSGSTQNVNSSYSALGDTTGFTYVDNGNNLIGATLNLGPITNVTGPNGTFPVIPLLAGSAAIGAGDPGLVGTTDEIGTTRPQGPGVDMGAIERIPGIPAAVATTTNVNSGNASSSNPYVFTVTYSDDVAMNYATINGNNNAITVTPPSGVGPVTVTFVSATPTSGATITATYQFTVAGGWVATDNGTWTINMAANQVKNTSNISVPAGPIGTFSVTLPRTITVTNTNDSGPGSFRAAILQANLDNPAPDVIVFSNTTAGGNTNFFDGSMHTITLLSGLPTVNDPVTITGPGANAVTLSGGGNTGRLFNDAATSLSVSGMTLTGGVLNGAGAAFNMVNGNETLSITNSVITGNSASFAGAAVYHQFGGSVTITGSTVSNNTSGGGAIWMNENGNGTGALNLVNSSVINNLSSGQGGAIGYFWGGPLNITSSSITGNSASGVGGVAYFWGSDGFGNGNYNVTISNSTLANNTSGSGGGGAINFDTGSGIVNVTSSTFTGNVATGSNGGVFIVDGGGTQTINLDNSILAGNSASAGTAIFSSSAVNSSYDAIDDQTGFTYVPGTGDLSAANSTVAALALQPLANQTGPNGTFGVIGIGTGSTAIDVGDPSLAGTTDQIGTSRPVGAGVDIGAIEKVNAPPPHIGSVVVGSGTQRSQVRSITVTFDTAVTFSGGNSNAAAAFQLLHTVYDTTTYNTLVANLQTAVTTNGSGQTVVTITFTTTGNAASEVDPNSSANTYPGGPTTPSLGDGRFTLTVLASNVSGPGGALAGNGTTAGTNYVSSSTSGVNGYGDIYRLFGDATGNGIDDLNDLNAFRNTYNAGFTNPSYLAYMDYDNDGVIDLDDLAGFRSHYNHHV